MVYSLLKNIATVPQKSQLKWARDLEACQKNEIHKIDNIDWKTVYSISFSCTSSTSLRTLYFKYLHRRIPTKTLLMKCKIFPTEKCTFCKSEPETTIHLFFQCSYVNVFWQTIIRWIKSFSNQGNINFSKAMQLGLQTCETSVLNLIMLTTKHFIFNMQITKTKPKFVMCRQTLNLVFTRKWKPFYML